MKSTVYFCDAHARSQAENKLEKIKRLAIETGLKQMIQKDDFCAIKLHFGEPGNDTHLRPSYARQIVNLVRDCGGKPFLTDTNTLYGGLRHNTLDHMISAYENGFSYATVQAPVIIADGLTGTNVTDVEISAKHFSHVTIAADIVQSNAMVVLSHVKGHELAGFGGAIKNLAMGCAPPKGKRDQHEIRFFIDEEKCATCGTCEEACPTGAISENENHTRKIDKNVCVGCGECATVCQPNAVQADWETDIPAFMERMTEYALGAVKGKEKKTIYINFLQNITPDCDCVAWSDTPLVPDIGILASTDPVAIDRASYDLVTQAHGLSSTLLPHAPKEGEDKFKAVWNYTQSLIQVSYAEKLGMGTQNYELIKL